MLGALQGRNRSEDSGGHRPTTTTAARGREALQCCAAPHSTAPSLDLTSRLTAELRHVCVRVTRVSFYVTEMVYV